LVAVIKIEAKQKNSFELSRLHNVRQKQKSIVSEKNIPIVHTPCIFVFFFVVVVVVVVIFIEIISIPIICPKTPALDLSAPCEEVGGCFSY